jgi:3-hydroxyisobutyrate dehydrogenase-like beta-hydroxyacid dehydrogenase
MNPVKCSFIGLGKMGRELCARIGGAGFRTLAYDINPEASKFAEENYENVTDYEYHF